MKDEYHLISAMLVGAHTKVGMTFSGRRSIENSEIAVKATETVKSRFMMTM